MTLLVKTIKLFQDLAGRLNQRLTNLITTSPLTYAPDGWNTKIPAAAETGWNSSMVSSAEAEKWPAFCKAVAGVGPLGLSHEHTDLTITENISFHNVNMTFGYVLARAAHLRTRLSVLDYGGGLGHYYSLAKALMPDLSLHYSCKDVPSMVELGRKLNPDICWFTDDSCLDSTYDLVIISGSFQYIRHWQEFLRTIARTTGNYLLLTRIPIVNTAPSFVAVQQAYGTQMLTWQFNRAELMRAIDDAGFTIVRELLAGDCPRIKNAPEQCDLRGWLLRRH